MNRLFVTLCLESVLVASCLAQEYWKITGDDLVRGNAKKEEGYTQAQLQNISKALKGKELTFHNGKVTLVRKDEDDGSVSVTVEFEAPAGGLFRPTFDVDARVPASGAKAVEKQLGYFSVKLNEGETEISADLFVNKVAFYLWNDVFKDCELDGDAFKITREDGDGVLAFEDFFKEDGSINEDVLKNFLTVLVPAEETVSEGGNVGGSVAGPVIG